MPETITPEKADMTREQLAQGVIDRTRAVIETANARRQLTGAIIRENSFELTIKSTGRSAWAGDEIDYETSYSASLDNQGGVGLRVDKRAYRGQAGQQKSRSYDDLLISADGSMEFSEGQESRRHYDNDNIRKLYGPVGEPSERVRTNLSADQMVHFGNNILNRLEEALEQ